MVYSWGDGAKGQLGQGNRLPSLKPKLVEALVTKRIIAIAAGFDHTLALSGTNLTKLFLLHLGLVNFYLKFKSSEIREKY